MKLSTTIRVAMVAALLAGSATVSVKMQGRVSALEQQLQESAAIIEAKAIEIQGLTTHIGELDMQLESVPNMTFELLLPSGLTMDCTATVGQVDGQWNTTLNFTNLGVTATMATEFMVNGSQYSLSLQEYDLLARTVRAESGAMSDEANIATANVILNRVQSDKFPNTIADVIHQPNQFEVVSVGTYNQQATEKAMRAVTSALNGTNVVPDMLGFWAPKWLPAGHELEQYIVEYQIGDHVFSKFERK